MNKRNKLLSIFTIMLLLIPFSIQSLYAQWTYYEAPAISDSITIVPGLGAFTFGPPYPNEYPPTQEGEDNNTIFDHISGGQVDNTPNKDGWPMKPSNDGISLTDPKSPINKALESTNISQDKPYITSKDVFDTNEDGRINRNDKTAKEYFYGKDAQPNDNFVIVRETFDNWFTQYYSIYTTTVDLNSLNYGDNVVYVYKTTIKWSRNIGIGSGPITEGDYTVTTTGNIRGICQVARVPVYNKSGNIRDTKFFDYNTFKQG